MVSVSVPSESQPFWVALSGRPVVMPEATTPVIDTVWWSLRSTSVKVTVPLAVSSAVEPVGLGWLGLVRSVIVPVCVPLVMTGVSLVPVTVIVTGWVTTPPWPSSTCTV